jgi:hypothetical protein
MRDESHGKVSPALSLGDQGACLLHRFSPRGLAGVPTLILYAERESAVPAECSPTRCALGNTPRTWFPQGECRLITNRRGSPVQHASLIFHCSDFQPSIAAFYHRLKSGKARQAA